jgi:hypothetical protein
MTVDAANLSGYMHISGNGEAMDEGLIVLGSVKLTQLLHTGKNCWEDVIYGRQNEPINADKLFRGNVRYDDL